MCDLDKRVAELEKRLNIREGFVFDLAKKVEDLEKRKKDAEGDAEIKKWQKIAKELEEDKPYRYPVYPTYYPPYYYPHPHYPYAPCSPYNPPVYVWTSTSGGSMA